ncbi:MAG: hypothetical protein NTV31_14850 [Bacteroidia bacterium]|nr:hypothetical protein [Bacteroidia bacterium]
MKNRINYIWLSLLLVVIAILCGCSKDGYLHAQNNFLKKIISDGYVVEQISYNQNNLVSEVNSRLFYRKFHYDNNNKLIKEEIAISPDSFSSSMPSGMTHEFVDPDKTGISMYSVYEYSENGNLSRQLNYVPSNGQDELRSIRTFEYDNNRISKVLLHDGDEILTQFLTFHYDNNGNVIEENSFSCLFIPAGTGPTHLSKVIFEYDSYFNPYKIFKQTGRPGINSNLNNIIKIKTYNLEHTSGIDDYSESEIAYEYNHESGYPVKVINGEEYIYD